MENLSLRITSFHITGETTTTGLPTVFVRLTGCLRCVYCDTAYAFEAVKNGYPRWLDTVAIYDTDFITSLEVSH